MKCLVILLPGLVLTSSLARADICRETDEFGNVSYVNCSEATSDKAVPVKVNPLNTMDSKEFVPDAGSIPAERPQSEAAKKKADHAAKENELEAARKALEEAKQVREGDRKGTVTGSRLTEQYFERVRKAEERVKQAEENLKNNL